MTVAALAWAICSGIFVTRGAAENTDPSYSDSPVIIASYNLENYLGSEPAEDVQHRRAAPKSEQAMKAVLQVISDIKPDILGVCEMGSLQQFGTFKNQLTEAGFHFTDSEYVNGPDSDRHIALVSRFPIISRQSMPDVTFEMNGAPEKVKRGFLDVTVRINPGYDLRLIGVHLKSKLAEMGEKEALIRRHEAELLRKHVDEIVGKEPGVNLLVYGDFNETKDQPAIHEIRGARGAPGALTDLPAKDALGDRWTEFWPAEDLYSRIDYFFANARVLRAIVPESTVINRSPCWNEASDHRAIFTTLRPENPRR